MRAPTIQIPSSNTNPGHEDGFTLIEVVVAVALASIVFIGLGAVINASIRSTQARRMEQQALAIVTEASETAASLSYAELALLDSDPTHGFTGGDTWDPDGAGPLPAEDLVLESTGGANPHVRQETRSNVTYTIQQWVTYGDSDPTDTEFQDFKRAITEVSWDLVNTTQTRRTESIVFKRAQGEATGVEFELAEYAHLVIDAVPGEKILFPNVLSNVGGATDSYDIDIVQEIGWIAELTRNDGLPLVDTNANFLLDTGWPVGQAAGTDLDLDFTVEVPADAEPGDYDFIEITFISTSDPTVSTVFEFVAQIPEPPKDTGGGPTVP